MFRIFTIAPEALGLFSFGKEYKEVSEDMYASVGFKKHAKGVISTVNTAVGMLDNEMDPLVKVLKDLGKRHAGYGVVDAHYPVVGQALLETLSDAMGEKFTPEVEGAWKEIYGVISETMMDGAKEANGKNCRVQ